MRNKFIDIIKRDSLAMANKWAKLVAESEYTKTYQELSEQERTRLAKDVYDNLGLYYRLLRGLQNLFSGIRRLFCFRLKKSEKEALRRTALNDYPLFRHLAFDDFWLEQVA
jgi:hypothetical protein